MWAGPDGKISQWGRIPYNNKLVHTPVTAAATAYHPGLYSLTHVPEDEVQQVEDKLFQRIETGAKPVLDRLIRQGPRSLSVEERYWWTIYLNASLLRVPHMVERVTADVRAQVELELSHVIPEFEAAKGNAPEKTLYEWASRHAPARVHNSGMKVLVELIQDEKPLDRIIHLRWLVKDVSAGKRELLLGDNPFLRVGDLYGSRVLIAMPLSPTHVFLASDAADILDHLARFPARDFTTKCNQSTLFLAKKFVYGEAERSFIDRHLPPHRFAK